MRNINIFRTDVRDHIIPRHILLQAMRLSPGADWTDPETQAYNYLKRWALNEDLKKEGPLQLSKDIVEEQAKITKDIKENLMEKSLQRFEGCQVPLSVINEGMELSPGKKIDDKRTKAYKYLKNWTQDNGNEDKDS